MTDEEQGATRRLDPVPSHEPDTAGEPTRDLAPAPRPNDFPVRVELEVDLPRIEQPSTDDARTLLAQARELSRAALEVWADEGQEAYATWLEAQRIEFSLRARASARRQGRVRAIDASGLDLASRRTGTVLSIVAQDRVGPVREGFWAAMLAGDAIAAAMSGTLVDPARRGFGALRAVEMAPRADGRVHVGRHLIVPATLDDGGWATLCTLGLHKFGLPELELKRVPSNLIESSARVMAGVGQALLERSHPMPRGAVHRMELAIGHVQWALGLRPTALGEAPGRAVIVLRETRATGSFGPRLRLEAPREFRGRHDTWPQHLLNALVGPPRSRRAA